MHTAYLGCLQVSSETFHTAHATWVLNCTALAWLGWLQVANKRWKIDLKSRHEAALMLSAVNLPGGVQVPLHTPAV